MFQTLRKLNLQTYYVNVTFQWRPVEHQQGLQEGEHGGRRVLPAADHQSDLHPSGAGCSAQGRVDGGPEPESRRPEHSVSPSAGEALQKTHQYFQYTACTVCL